MYKLICFDLDGTLIDEIIFIWQAIHDAVDTPLEIRRKAMDDFFSKKITYAEWAKHDVKMWQDKNVTKERLKEVISPLKLMPGALETISELKKQGIEIIDKEMNQLLAHAKKEAERILTKHKDETERLVKKLLEVETVEQEEFNAIMEGKSVEKKEEKKDE